MHFIFLIFFGIIFELVLPGEISQKQKNLFFYKTSIQPLYLIFIVVIKIIVVVIKNNYNYKEKIVPPTSNREKVKSINDTNSDDIANNHNNKNDTNANANVNNNNNNNSNNMTNKNSNADNENKDDDKKQQ